MSKRFALALIGLFVCVSPSQAQVIMYDESVSGDLSDSQLAPAARVMVSGINRVLGTVGGGNSQDWLRVTIPAGFQMSVLTHVTYVSTDNQGFMGFDDAATFVGNAGLPGSYQGYAHFGNVATNGTLPAGSTVGANMLNIMANPAAYNSGQAPQGVTLPLGPGDYTFLFQQLGAASQYEFAFQATAVPEPTSFVLLGGATSGLWAMRRRNKKLAA